MRRAMRGTLIFYVRSNAYHRNISSMVRQTHHILKTTPLQAASYFLTYFSSTHDSLSPLSILSPRDTSDCGHPSLPIAFQRRFSTITCTYWDRALIMFSNYNVISGICCKKRLVVMVVLFGKTGFNSTFVIHYYAYLLSFNHRHSNYGYRTSLALDNC